MYSMGLPRRCEPGCNARWRSSESRSCLASSRSMFRNWATRRSRRGERWRVTMRVASKSAGEDVLALGSRGRLRCFGVWWVSIEGRGSRTRDVGWGDGGERLDGLEGCFSTELASSVTREV